jgi:hypothetical protein
VAGGRRRFSITTAEVVTIAAARAKALRVTRPATAEPMNTAQEQSSYLMVHSGRFGSPGLVPPEKTSGSGAQLNS